MDQRVRWLVVRLFLFSALSGVAGAQTLDEALSEMDALRAGRETPFVEVETRAQELLEQYTKPHEQGKICWQVADVFAQSGQVRPDATIAWVKKALRFPLEPAKRLELYVAWGHAIQVKHAGVRGEQLAAARREAVVPYLEGLREALAYKLPETIPERKIAVLIDDPQATEQELRRLRDQSAALRLQVFQERMILLRGILTDAVAFMYSRIPFAPEELRELAIEKLRDKAAVGCLMKAVEEAMAKRLEAPGLGGLRDATKHLKLAPTKQTEVVQKGDVLPAPGMPVVPEAKSSRGRFPPRVAHTGSTDKAPEERQSANWLAWTAIGLLAVSALVGYLIVLHVRRRSASSPPRRRTI